jgi:hypothetical protein
MAVMIKEVDKPITCGDCTFNIGRECMIRLCMAEDDEIEYEDEILTDCPLVEVEDADN